MENNYLKVFGSGKEIGASCFYLSINNRKILLDCGTNPQKEGFNSLPQIDFSDGKPDIGLITHTHLDHIGALPLFFRQIQFYVSKETKSIAKLMLNNSANIQLRNFYEKKQSTPLFTERDAKKAVKSLKTFTQLRSLQLKGKVMVHPYKAGHILGARSFYIESPNTSFLYTGDITLSDQLTLKKADIHGLKPDILMIEGTLGSEKNIAKNRQDEINRFGKSMSEILNKRECVLCPVFSVGKCQELLSICELLIHERKIPPVPIVINGLGIKVTRIYRNYLKDSMPFYKPIEISRFRNISFQNLLTKGPAIFLFTSGMMNKDTPSALLAQEILEQDKHAIFFVGYIAPETPGFSVLNSPENSEILLSEKHVSVTKFNKNIKKFRFTSHSDVSEISDFVYSLSPKKVILVHGEEQSLINISNILGNDFEVIIPKVGDKIIF